MRVLLDHNLPHKLRHYLEALCKHEIVTGSYMGWSELKNGELLRSAEEGGIEIVVAGDPTLVFKNHAPRILAAIDTAVPGSFQTVDCGTFSRKETSDE